MITRRKTGPILGILISICLVVTSCYTALTPTISPRIVSEWSLEESNGKAGITNGTTGKINNSNYLLLAVTSSQDNGKLVETSIRILDLEDPSKPLEVGHIKAVDEDSNNLHYIMDMELSGNLIYAIVDNYLWIVDVSDPSAPKEIALLPTYYPQITISGDYAYISVVKNPNNVGFIVLDISDPALPKEVGTSELLPRGLNGFLASGSLLFVVTEDGLHIVDISSPNSLEEIAFVPHPNDEPDENKDLFQDVAVAGKYAYVTSRESGLYVFDISNPSSPKKVASLDTNERASSILVSGDLVYIVDWRKMTSMEGNTTPILIIDVSNPNQPKELAFVELPVYSGNFHFAEAKNHIYWFSNASSIISIVDVYAPATE